MSELFADLVGDLLPQLEANIKQLKEERDEYYSGYEQLMNRNAELIERIKQLEQLCRDMYEFACVTGSGGAEKAFTNRMQSLGLLEDEQ